MYVGLTLMLSLAAVETSTAGALWSTRGFDAADAAEVGALETALAKSLGIRLLDRDGVAMELMQVAQLSEPAAQKDGALRPPLATAREAFVELRLGVSMKAYQQALDEMMNDDRRPADAREAAQVLFERSLVALAAHSKESAARDLRTAIHLDPTLAPDPDVYGPPVLRAVAKVKHEDQTLPLFPLAIDRAPEDAVVRVDGRVVAAGEVARVRGRGPHLITAERLWHRPRSELVELDARGTTVRAVVLERASGALLAAHVLDVWHARSADASVSDPLSGELAVMIARCLQITSVVEATKSADGELDVVLRDAASGEVVRGVRGRRNDWEPYPYAALAESLEGRFLAPPGAASESRPRFARTGSEPTSREESAPLYARWYFWGSVAVAIAGGTALAIALQGDAPAPEHVLVFEGPK